MNGLSVFSDIQAYFLKPSMLLKLMALSYGMPALSLVIKTLSQEVASFVEADTQQWGLCASLPSFYGDVLMHGNEARVLGALYWLGLYAKHRVERLDRLPPPPPPVPMFMVHDVAGLPCDPRLSHDPRRAG